MPGSIGELIRYRLIGFSISNWLLPSYMVTDQKASTGGNCPAGKVSVYLCLEPVEDLAVSKRLRHWIDGLGSVVAIDAALGGGGTLQPVAAVELPASEQRSDFPSIYVLLSGSKILYNLLFAVFHPQSDFNLVRQRKILGVEGLSGADADARELGADFLFLRSGRRELQGKIEIFEEVLLYQLRIGLGKVNTRARRLSLVVVSDCQAARIALELVYSSRPIRMPT
jgi:hypothetical protein